MCVGKKQDYLNYKEIGKNIRYFRQRAGLKQNELSDRIDMSPQHISHIESGEPLSLILLFKSLMLWVWMLIAS